MNLAGKKLVLVNHTSGEIKDTHIIKAYSEQDILRGRSMHNQEINDIIPAGIILAIGNDLLTTMDTVNAIARRVRIFETRIVLDSRVPLISRKKFNTW